MAHREPSYGYRPRRWSATLLALWTLSVGCGSAPGAPADASSADSPAPDAGTDPRLSRSAFALVDPFIGTDGTGFGAPNCHPGATLPFGMVQAGPDTTRPGGAPAFEHATGYHWDDSLLLGFSHNRLSGVSTPDLGAILVAAANAEPAALVDVAARTTPFDHADEHAEPGYYAVQLRAPEVLAEVAATTRAAHHRYRFGGSAAARLVIDVGHAHDDTAVPAAHVEVVGGDRIEGWVEHSGRFSSAAVGGFRTYFSAVVSPMPSSAGTYADGAYADSVDSRDGAAVGAVLSFDAREVTLRLALSYVSVEGARANLEAELPASATFDATRSAAAEVWRAQLDKLRFEGGDGRTREVLATALYRSFVAPNVFADVDGSYRAVDGTVRRATEHVQHHFFSLWDTYRTVHPLLTLVDPLRQRDMARSLVQMGNEAGGLLPRWTAGHASTSVTLGAPADIVLAESLLKGIDLPGDATLDLILQSAETPPPPGSVGPGREGVSSYVRLGHVAADEQNRSVSRTLEYAIADASIARLAEQLGRADVAARFAERGRNYALLFDAESKTFRGRNADGAFVAPFNRTAYEEHDLYYGGNAAQYAWLAPHDPVGLLALFGSPEAAVDELDAFFMRGRRESERGAISSVLPPTGYTQHNEPDIHAAYLFLAAGRPDLAQTWAAWIAEARYGDGPDGIPGNEDSGALSAWFVWSAIGLYPSPGQDWYFVGRPLVDRVELSRSGGSLIVTRSGVGPYVERVSLDGRALPHPWLTHGELMTASALEFVLSEAPGAWGRDFGAPPR